MSWYGPMPVTTEEYEESELNKDFEDALSSTDQTPLHDVGEDNSDPPSQSGGGSRDNGDGGGDDNRHDTSDGDNIGDGSNDNTAKEQAGPSTLDRNTNTLSTDQVSLPLKTPDMQNNSSDPGDMENPNCPDDLNGSENDQSSLQTGKVAGACHRKSRCSATDQKSFGLNSTSKGLHLYSWNALGLWGSGSLVAIGTGMIAIGVAIYVKERRSLRP